MGKSAIKLDSPRWGIRFYDRVRSILDSKERFFSPRYSSNFSCYCLDI